ncbi:MULTISPECIES: hypothetical protein [Myxococcus]|uniref:hypothetical protein n=1 Tax=Myxococcus TaxID=32 RepID=UPI00114217B2|nr:MULTISPECIES: hypothetical protein [Myxococcus]NOK06680.1 hypothetical protein [Myxococcus xanthus]
MTTCAVPLPPPSAPTRADTLTEPPSAEEEMELLLHLLRELPTACREARRAESRLAELVRPHLVRVAHSVAREWDVSAHDLVQEGLLAVFHRQRRHPFMPGLAGAGRSAFPAHAMRLGRQAMVLAATRERSPVYVTDHARKTLRRAKKAAREAEVSVADALAAEGLEAATAHALGDGTVHSAMPVEELLGLADSPEGRDRGVLQARAMIALHGLPRLQRLVVSATVGVGQPGSRAMAERTLAAEWRLPVARVRKLRAAGLRKLRQLLEAPLPCP